MSSPSLDLIALWLPLFLVILIMQDLIMAIMLEALYKYCKVQNINLLRYDYNEPSKGVTERVLVLKLLRTIL